jgi:hypothetical protein
MLLHLLHHAGLLVPLIVRVHLHLDVDVVVRLLAFL